MLGIETHDSIQTKVVRKMLPEINPFALKQTLRVKPITELEDPIKTQSRNLVPKMKRSLIKILNPNAAQEDEQNYVMASNPTGVKNYPPQAQILTQQPNKLFVIRNSNTTLEGHQVFSVQTNPNVQKFVLKQRPSSVIKTSSKHVLVPMKDLIPTQDANKVPAQSKVVKIPVLKGIHLSPESQKIILKGPVLPKEMVVFNESQMRPPKNPNVHFLKDPIDIGDCVIKDSEGDETPERISDAETCAADETTTEQISEPISEPKKSTVENTLIVGGLILTSTDDLEEPQTSDAIEPDTILNKESHVPSTSSQVETTPAIRISSRGRIISSTYKSASLNANTTSAKAKTTSAKVKKTPSKVKTTLPEVKTTLPEVKTTLPEVKTTLPEVKTTPPKVTKTLSRVETTPPPVPSTSTNFSPNLDESPSTSRQPRSESSSPVIIENAEDLEMLELPPALLNLPNTMPEITVETQNYIVHKGDYMQTKKAFGQIRKHTCPQPPYYCSHCKNDFSPFPSLIRHWLHLKLHCGACDKVFPTPEVLKAHLKEVHSIKGYKCTNCNHIECSLWNLRIHQIRGHCQEYRHLCEDCDKSFQSAEKLQQHVEQVHSTPHSSTHLCDICGKASTNYYTLQCHIRSVHQVLKYPCKKCNKILYTKTNFNRHVRWHQKQGKIVCELCGKRFDIQFSLKMHMRQHTGEKPYVCTICSKAFAKRTTLRQHLLIHTGKRPYVCDICGKSFTQKPGLTAHRKSHPGDLPPMPSLFIDEILKDLPEAAFQNMGPKKGDGKRKRVEDEEKEDDLEECDNEECPMGEDELEDEDDPGLGEEDDDQDVKKDVKKVALGKRDKNEDRQNNKEDDEMKDKELDKMGDTDDKMGVMAKVEAGERMTKGNENDNVEDDIEDTINEEMSILMEELIEIPVSIEDNLNVEYEEMEVIEGEGSSLNKGEETENPVNDELEEDDESEEQGSKKIEVTKEVKPALSKKTRGRKRTKN